LVGFQVNRPAFVRVANDTAFREILDAKEALCAVEPMHHQCQHALVRDIRQSIPRACA
jgi:hypothetical protein